MAKDRNYSPYQQKIIGRYYDNRDQIDQTRLGDLAAELYLADGKKRERLWQQAGELMQRLGVPPTRLEHVLKTADPAILAEVVQDIHRGAIKPPAPAKKGAAKGKTEG